MRFVTFGRCPPAVLDVLPRLGLRIDTTGDWAVGASADDLAVAQSYRLVTLRNHSTLARDGGRMLLLTEREAAAIAHSVESVLSAYVEVIRRTVTEIHDCYQATSPATIQSVSWFDVAHVLVVGWFMDLSVTGAARQAWQTNDPRDWLVLGFESLLQRCLDCGVRLQYQERDVFGEVWFGGHNRQPAIPVNLAPGDLSLVRRLSTGASGGGSTPGVDLNERLALHRLCYLGLVTRYGSVYASAIPLFSASDCAMLLAAMRRGVSEAIELLTPALARSACAASPGLCLAWLRVLLTRACAALAQLDALPDVPDVLPRAWGLWCAADVQDLPLFYPFTPDSTYAH
jgi:hypothetical protein